MRTSVFRTLIAASWRGLLSLAAASAVAEPPPPAEMQAAHQVRGDSGERDWLLDPAVFIDLSPVTAAEPALRLPEDQRDDPVSGRAVESD
jgi:hypothetical protein